MVKVLKKVLNSDLVCNILVFDVSGSATAAWLIWGCIYCSWPRSSSISITVLPRHWFKMSVVVVIMIVLRMQVNCSSDCSYNNWDSHTGVLCNVKPCLNSVWLSRLSCNSMNVGRLFSNRQCLGWQLTSNSMNVSKFFSSREEGPTDVVKFLFSSNSTKTFLFKLQILVVILGRKLIILDLCKLPRSSSIFDPTPNFFLVFSLSLFPFYLISWVILTLLCFAELLSHYIGNTATLSGAMSLSSPLSGTKLIKFGGVALHMSCGLVGCLPWLYRSPNFFFVLSTLLVQIPK